MKFMIIQSFIGSGTWYFGDRRENLTRLYNEVLIPSVSRYCEKHGYKHVVYRDQYDLIEIANQKYGDHHGNLYHEKISALKHKDDDVDYIVFMDADFYITNNARALVPTSCIRGNVWNEEHIRLYSRGKDPKTFTAVMGGIQIMKKEAAINLATYIKSWLSDYILHDTPIRMLPDEVTVGEWMVSLNIKPEPLSQYYNRLLEEIENREWTEEDNLAGFWHLAGPNKPEKLAYLLDHMDRLQ